MFTKSSLIALLTVAMTVATTSDVFAGTRHRHHTFWGFGRSCCAAADSCAPAMSAPAATAAVPGTYRSFSYEPSAPAPVYVAPAPSRTPSYMLPKTDPRRYNGDR